MSDPIARFDWNSAFMQHRDCLPHLRQAQVLYFVTFRMADSLPARRVEQLRLARDRWLADHPLPHAPEDSDELRKLWTVPLERLLDASHGACLLRLRTCREALESTMRHDDTVLYRLGNFVIMPNHVHALLHVANADGLSTILQAWKSISARRINRIVHRRGMLWQPESFDHIVRDPFRWARFVAYINKNPAHLPPGTFTVGCGSLAIETAGER